MNAKLITLFLFFVLSHQTVAEEVEPNLVNAAALKSPTTYELTNSWQIGKVQAGAGWALGATGLGIRVGVIDTGVFNTKELGSRLLGGWNFVKNKAIAANTNSDDNGHGTHVSGIIAAESGTTSPITTSVVGVAPEAFIVPIKVLDSRGSGTLTNLSKGQIGRAHV